MNTTENLTRLDQSTLQYRKWSSLFNKIHPKEKTELRSWLSEFIENKVRSQLIELEIKYSLAIPPIEVYMHPLLLGQCFETLFSNACEAISQSHADNKQITITTHQKITGHAAIEIRFENTGKLFSEELLLNQAHSPVKSTTGLGIGLSLMRKILELADADIALANASGKARVSLFIPGIVK